MFRSRNHWGQLRNEVSCAINRVQHINKSSWRIVHKSIQIRFKGHFCLSNPKWTFLYGFVHKKYDRFLPSKLVKSKLLNICYCIVFVIWNLKNPSFHINSNPELTFWVITYQLFKSKSSDISARKFVRKKCKPVLLSNQILI